LKGRALESLVGKRISLAGLSGETAARFAAALEESGAYVNEFPATGLLPGSDLLAEVDLAIFSLEAAATWLALAGRRGDKPFLVADSLVRLSAQLPRIRRTGFDFIADNADASEVCLRAAMLLREELAGRPARTRPPLIVAADDEMSITALVKAVLVNDGMTCETRNNGGDALELTRRLKPDVLVLDIHMPRMGGFEVLSAVKQEPAIAQTRVILLTGAEQESDIMRGFSLGAADYVVKPFNPMELLFRIRRFVRT
jgi:CheY-like chemotaxis protein